MGNDGDAADAFLGFYPQSETAFVINQRVAGKFDEHKVMLAFPDEETARRAYLHSYERGWKWAGEPCSCLDFATQCGGSRTGIMRHPLRADNLPCAMKDSKP